MDGEEEEGGESMVSFAGGGEGEGGDFSGFAMTECDSGGRCR